MATKTTTVPFPRAIMMGGYYFKRAQELGLPEPPYAVVFPVFHNKKEEAQQKAYHKLLVSAEIRIHHEAIGKLGGSAKSDAKTIAVRENAKKGGWPKGRKRK